MKPTLKPQEKRTRINISKTLIYFGLSGIKGFVTALSTCAWLFIALVILQSSSLYEQLTPTGILNVTYIFWDYWKLWFIIIWSFDTIVFFKEIRK